MRLAIAALALALSISPARAQPSPMSSLSAGESLLTIGSQGRHLATPDLVRLAVGATTTEASSREAARLNSELTSRLIAVVRGAGIAARDVQTLRLTLEPTFQSNRSSGQPDRIVGFVARNEVIIRIRDLERAPALLGALFEAGATDVRGPQFTLQDPTPARRLAEKAAVSEARSKADNLAAALGKRVGRLLSISSQDYYSEIVVTGSRVSRNAAETPLEAGEIAVTASIQAVFTLVDR